MFWLVEAMEQECHPRRAERNAAEQLTIEAVRSSERHLRDLPYAIGLAAKPKVLAMVPGNRSVLHLEQPQTNWLVGCVLACWAHWANVGLVAGMIQATSVLGPGLALVYGWARSAQVREVRTHCWARGVLEGMRAAVAWLLPDGLEPDSHSAADLGVLCLPGHCTAAAAAPEQVADT